METQTWTQALEGLRVPFAVELVSWKPQAFSRDRRRCMAVPYVETQPYQERLDNVCPEWQDDYAIWFSDPQEMLGRGGEKKVISGKVFVKCRLTIGEHTRADVGECELTDENAMTSAKAQAFKRACAAFGLGRYLYNLPPTWADYDEDKGIPESELRRFEMILRRHPARDAASDSAASAQNGAPARNAPLQAVARPAGSNGKSSAAPAPAAKLPEAGKNGADAKAPVGRVFVQDLFIEEGGAKSAEPPAVAETKHDADNAAKGKAVEGAADAGPEQAALCPIHHVPLQMLVTRAGKSLLLHRVDGQGYCNGEVVKPARS